MSLSLAKVFLGKWYANCKAFSGVSATAISPRTDCVVKKRRIKLRSRTVIKVVL